MSDNDEGTDWDNAACLGMNVDMFFFGATADRHPLSDLVVHVCGHCEIQEACFDAGVRRNEGVYNGVWGGVHPRALRTLSRKTRNGKDPLTCDLCSTEVDPLTAALAEKWKCEYHGNA